MSRQFSSDKDVRSIVRLAIQSGWKVEKGGGNHILFYPPDKEKGIVTMSSTPSSPRNHKNVLSKLRARGLKV